MRPMYWMALTILLAPLSSAHPVADGWRGTSETVTEQWSSTAKMVADSWNQTSRQFESAWTDTDKCFDFDSRADQTVEWSDAERRDRLPAPDNATTLSTPPSLDDDGAPALLLWLHDAGLEGSDKLVRLAAYLDERADSDDGTAHLGPEDPDVWSARAISIVDQASHAEEQTFCRTVLLLEAIP